MENRFFPEIKNMLGLGCMRLPTLEGGDGDIDYELCDKMVDRFMEAGFNYFDTAKVYHAGASEKMIKRCIADRYDRSEFILTDKLSDGCFETEEDIRPLFEKQLKTCGVDYFDFYLMHAQRSEVYQKYIDSHAYDIAQELKAEGKIRHVGLSFHDDADMLRRILDDHPEMEIVQIQFNYADFDSPTVQSRELYEICEERDIPVLIMEPVRGGTLVELPDEAQAVLDGLRALKAGAADSDGDHADAGVDDVDHAEVSVDEEMRGADEFDASMQVATRAYSNAGYALRFVASFPQVAMVLSGMGNMDMVEENVATFSDFEYIDEDELDAISKVRSILKNQNTIPCTACHYCTEGCPKHIRIPDLFADYNAKKTFKSWNADFYYTVHTDEGTKASDCIKCGQCEHECPQKLKIRDLLEQVAEEFER